MRSNLSFENFAAILAALGTGTLVACGAAAPQAAPATTRSAGAALPMSLGGVDPLDEHYLTELAAFVRDVRTPWHSDHLCFGAVGGTYLHDLLPLPFKRATATRVADRIKRARDALREGRELQPADGVRVVAVRKQVDVATGGEADGVVGQLVHGPGVVDQSHRLGEQERAIECDPRRRVGGSRRLGRRHAEPRQLVGRQLRDVWRDGRISAPPGHASAMARCRASSTSVIRRAGSGSASRSLQRP